MTFLPSDDFGNYEELAPGFDLLFSSGGDGQTNQMLRSLISSVSYEDDEEMSSMLELTIINQPDITVGIGAKTDWSAVLDCKAFQEGNFIDLFIGYAGLKTFIGRVEIVKWLPRFGQNGPSEFVIKGYDGRHRMMGGIKIKEKQKSSEKGSKKTGNKCQISVLGQPAKSSASASKKKHVFSGMSDDVIVKKIADKYGFLSVCDPIDSSMVARTSSSGSGKGDLFAFGKVFKNMSEYNKYKSLHKIKETKPPKQNQGGNSGSRSSGFPARIQTEEQTDWQFLQKLAAINRFDLWVDYDFVKNNWVVHFLKRKDVDSAMYTFTYNGRDGSLLEAEPDFSLHEQSTSVEVVYFDTSKKSINITEIFENKTSENVSFSSASLGNLTAKKTLATGARVRFTAFGQTIEAISNKQFKNQKDAGQFANDWLKEKERDLILLKGKVIGIPSLRPRQVHEFDGMSNRIDGFYRLTQCKHILSPSSPYIVEFVAHKILSEEIVRRKQETKQPIKSQKGKIIKDPKIT